MEIKTKFNIGDTIVAVKNHKLTEFKVASICTGNFLMDENETFSSISYSGKEGIPFDEKDCFASREEYINQL